MSQSVTLKLILASSSKHVIAWLARAHSKPQRRYGATLEALLIPKDLRHYFFGAAPLVMILDASTARVHWEMMVQPDWEFTQPSDIHDSDPFPVSLSSALPAASRASSARSLRNPLSLRLPPQQVLKVTGRG